MRKFLTLLTTIVVSVFALVACGSSPGASASKNPVSLVGEWYQINHNPDSWMTASISGESIQVDFRSSDYRSIFWMGSFDTRLKQSGKFKIVSLGDQDAMRWQIAASTEKQKTFTYDHGILSFEFSVLGSSTTIHMTKSKSAIVVKPTPTKK